MFGILKKPFTLLLTGSFSVVFAACYGAPIELENPKLIKATNDNNLPIEGLKVTLFDNNKAIDEQLTNAKGIVELNFKPKENHQFSASIEDIDGIKELGEFNSTSINLETQSVFEIKMNQKHSSSK